MIRVDSPNLPPAELGAFARLYAVPPYHLGDAMPDPQHKTPEQVRDMIATAVQTAGLTVIEQGSSQGEAHVTVFDGLDLWVVSAVPAHVVAGAGAV